LGENDSRKKLKEVSEIRQEVGNLKLKGIAEGSDQMIGSITEDEPG